MTKLMMLTAVKILSIFVVNLYGIIILCRLYSRSAVKFKWVFWLAMGMTGFISTQYILA